MLEHTIRIATGSRLHFGMIAFGHEFTADCPRQFGGVGLIIREPGIRLCVTPATKLEATGPLAERALDVWRRAAAAANLASAPSCRLQIESMAREHVGLGTGTQLGMALATAMHILVGRPLASPGELAATVGRGKRSAIGSHGFAVGGLLVEAGKRRPEEISPLVARVELPRAWRILLLMPRKATGLFGDAEREAFSRLPPVSAATTASLCSEVLLNLLPAAAEADFDAFSASVCRFGQLAGSLFATQQNGQLFFDPAAARLAARLQELGIRGIGQSSWGPTIFGIVQNESAGLKIAEQIRSEANASGYDCLLSAIENQGAHVDVE
jgi:beta-ribofuranosylaminobenzene 5'-phosphate synthase